METIRLRRSNRETKKAFERGLAEGKALLERASPEFRKLVALEVTSRVTVDPEDLGYLAAVREMAEGKPRPKAQREAHDGLASRRMTRRNSEARGARRPQGGCFIETGRTSFVASPYPYQDERRLGLPPDATIPTTWCARRDSNPEPRA